MGRVRTVLERPSGWNPETFRGGAGHVRPAARPSLSASAERPPRVRTAALYTSIGSLVLTALAAAPA
ncbi:hypothetical protein B5180_39485, partial [Streptomyces sp. BF-3]